MAHFERLRSMYDHFAIFCILRTYGSMCYILLVIIVSFLRMLWWMKVGRDVFK